MEVTTLWKERAGDFWNEAIRYLKLIGNSGFMFSLYALFLAGGYFYPAFIEWLPSSLPVDLILAAVFMYLLTRTPIRTFLKEADLVFLLPIETRLSSFFRRSIIYSNIMQSVSISIIYLLLGPLFQDRVSSDSSYLYTVLLALLIANVWNNMAYWAELRLQDARRRFRHQLGRLMINGVFTFLLFTYAPLWFAGAVLFIMIFLYVFYYLYLLKEHALKWNLLLSIEQKRLSAFYRFVQAFTDVPYVRAAVKRRKFVSAIASRFLWKEDAVYSVLFGKAFVRSGEYLGMYLRLLLAGGLVMYAFPSDWVRLGVGVLFLYMTSMQLKTLWHHLDTSMWPDLYPIAFTDKQKAFRQLLKKLLVLQTFFLVIVSWLVSTSVLLGVVILAAGLVFSFYYPELMWKNTRLQTKEEGL